ncbi:MAG: acetate--CoA ligase family protein [Deltaproteobacteria bacterium]|nr:MAG: acetate--CoA ligase family protein [Deltaproteobacteria bacterium]
MHNSELVKSYEPLFNPRSVAVVGASSMPGKWGFIIPMNLILRGYSGKVFMINHSEKTVLGSPAYKSVKDIEDDLDLVVVAVPAPVVSSVIRDCGEKGVKNVVVISANFRETGPEGEKRERELIDTAGEFGIRIIGPNCMGICSPKNKLFALGAPVGPPPGNISFISQSGNLGIQLLSWADRANLGISRFVSSGNEANTKSHHLMEYLGADPETKVIIMYLEGINEGERFLSVAREVIREKPIIALKIGKSEAGARAARSHSGSITGSRAVFEAAVKQAGIIEVTSTEEMIDMARSFGQLPYPKGNRVALMTLGGGWGVVSADQCEARGLALPQLSEETIKQINRFLPDFWSHSNPVDLVGSLRRSSHFKAMQALIEDDNFDGMITLGALLGGQTDRWSGYRTVAHIVKRVFLYYRHRVPLFLHNIIFRGLSRLSKEAKIARESYKQGIGSRSERLDPREFGQWGPGIYAKKIQSFMEESGKPIISVASDAFDLSDFYKKYSLIAFGSPEKAVNVMVGLVRYSNYLKTRGKDEEAVFHPDTERARKIWDNAGETLSEHEGKELLACYGISTTNDRPAATADEAVSAAESIGYPVAVKIDSPEITHKTDADGIRLSLTDTDTVRKAFAEVTANAKKFNHDANIRGVLVQEMVSGGTEVLIGSSRDPQFGPTIVFGLGGVFVEVLKDTSLRVVPLTRHDALKMVHEIRGIEILKGFRGSPPADIEAIIDTILKVNRLIQDFRDEIEEMDINPLMVFPEGKGVKALDSLIIKRPSKS